MEACHRRGIRVIVDFVPNHTSDRHPWFLESRSLRSNPKRDWHVWADPRPNGEPPNNWLSEFRIGGRPVPDWTLDEATGQCHLHSYLAEQPDLNWLNSEVRRAMTGVLRFWLDRGVDGFRIDAVQRIGHDPDLRDNVDGEPRHDEDLDVTREVVAEFRRVLDAYEARMAVGEVDLLDLERTIRYYGDRNDGFHLVFNFSFLRQPWRARAFREAAERFESLLPSGAWPDYTLSNHDRPRTVTRYDRGRRGSPRAPVAAMMLLTLRGTPFLYFGEEIGMADVPVPRERWQDPVGRDPCRTPMRWEPGRRHGFTTGEPWLPVGDQDAGNVEAQRGDPSSMLSLYRSLIWFRRCSSALRWGSFRPRDAGRDVFAYELHPTTNGSSSPSTSRSAAGPSRRTSSPLTGSWSRRRTPRGPGDGFRSTPSGSARLRGSSCGSNRDERPAGRAGERSTIRVCGGSFSCMATSRSSTSTPS